MHTYIQTNRHIYRLTHIHKVRQAQRERHTGSHIYIQKERETYGETVGQRAIHTETYIQADRRTDIPTERRVGSQARGHTHIHRDIQTNKHPESQTGKQVSTTNIHTHRPTKIQTDWVTGKQTQRRADKGAIQAVVQPGQKRTDSHTHIQKDWADRATNKHTDKPECINTKRTAEQKTGTQAKTHTHIQTNGQTNRQNKIRQTDKHTDIHIFRHTYIQSDIQSDMQRGRKPDRRPGLNAGQCIGFCTLGNRCIVWRTASHNMCLMWCSGARACVIRMHGFMLNAKTICIHMRTRPYVFYT